MKTIRLTKKQKIDVIDNLILLIKDDNISCYICNIYETALIKTHIIEDKIHINSFNMFPELKSEIIKHLKITCKDYKSLYKSTVEYNNWIIDSFTTKAIDHRENMIYIKDYPNPTNMDNEVLYRVKLLTELKEKLLNK